MSVAPLDSPPDRPSADAQAPALEARALTKRFAGVTIVDGVDLTATAGRITVIIGANGAGKTTLFNCLSGVDPPDSGEVLHRGTVVTGLPPDALARRGLARTFQRTSVFPTMTVAENLLVGAENHRRQGAMRGLFGLPDPVGRRSAALVAGVIAELGLRHVVDVRAGELPSGTLRLVELGRALCGEPDTLLLDEPASGLGDAETEEFHRLLQRLAARDLAVVMVEHDLALVHRAADDVYVMFAGRIVASGEADEVLGSAVVHDVLYGRRA